MGALVRWVDPGNPDAADLGGKRLWWMRGWWKPALICTVLGAAAGAAVSPWFSTLRYEATGRVMLSLLAPIDSDGNASQMPQDPKLIAGVFAREAALLERLADTGLPPQDAKPTSRADAARATANPPVSIALTVPAGDAQASHASLVAALNSYRERTTLHAEADRAAEAQRRLDALNAVLAEQRRVRGEIDAVLQKVPDGVVATVLDRRQDELAKLREKLVYTRRLLDEMETVAVGRETALVVLAETDSDVMSLLLDRADIAGNLQELEAQRKQSEAQQAQSKDASATRPAEQDPSEAIAEVQSDEQGGPGGQDATLASQIAALREQWQQVNDKLDRVAADTRIMPASWVGAPQDEKRLVAIRVSETQRRLGQTEEAIEALEPEVERLAVLAEQLRGLRASDDELVAKIESARAALREVARPTVVVTLEDTQADPPPTEPVRDTRLAWAGGLSLLGGLLGLGLVMTTAGADRRIRRPDPEPWSFRGAPLIGVVPEIRQHRTNVGQPMTDEELRQMQQDLSQLADAVHAVRAVIEGRLGRDANATPAICVTSAATGNGKTSLAVGLGSSLAMGGQRVLLIDAALSRRPAPGSNLSSAADEAQGDGRQTLDDVMIAMDYLEPEDRERLSYPDPEQPMGLAAVLAGVPLAEALVPTRMPGLALLSGSGVRPGDNGRVSNTFLRRLTAEAKATFDVILFDTGTVPVCVEALFVASASDGTILVVGRDENRAAVDSAIERLKLVNAQIMGTVFNRARSSAKKQAEQREGAPAEPARDMSWRNQGSGMFAAAVRARSTSGDPLANPRGQTGLYRGKPSTTGSAEEAYPVARSAPHTPINFKPAAANDETATPASRSVARKAGRGPQPAPVGPSAEDVVDRYVDSAMNSAIAAQAKPAGHSNGQHNPDSTQDPSA